MDVIIFMVVLVVVLVIVMVQRTSGQKRRRDLGITPPGSIWCLAWNEDTGGLGHDSIVVFTKDNLDMYKKDTLVKRIPYTDIVSFSYVSPSAGRAVTRVPTPYTLNLKDGSTYGFSVQQADSIVPTQGLSIEHRIPQVDAGQN